MLSLSQGDNPMTKLMKSAVLATLALGISGAAVESASAANRYAMVTLENPFKTITITYQFKWGEEGQWQTRTLYPGQSRWHSWKYAYPDQNRSPKLYIKFDADRYSGQYYWQTYWLVRYAVPDQASRGKVYRFKFNGPGQRYIEPYGVN